MRLESTASHAPPSRSRESWAHRGQIRFVSCVAAIASFLWLPACSNGADPSKSYRKALLSVETALMGPTADWSDAVAAAYRNGFEQTGRFDSDAVRRQVSSKAETVTRTGCNAIARHKKALRSDQDAPDLPQLSDFPKVQLAQAIGRSPAQLYAMRVRWPEPWLLDVTAQPDYDAPPQTFEPTFFSRYLKAAFTGPSGSVVFPAPGTPEYSNFKGLLYSKEAFAGRIATQAEPIANGLADCLGTG